MNKSVSYCGLILILIGSAVLIISASIQNPYQTDYTGIGIGAVTTAVGLFVSLLGGAYPDAGGRSSVRYSPGRRAVSIPSSSNQVSPSQTASASIGNPDPGASQRMVKKPYRARKSLQSPQVQAPDKMDEMQEAAPETETGSGSQSESKEVKKTDSATIPTGSTKLAGRKGSKKNPSES